MSDVRSLVSPRADFWLLGGASVVAWALMTLGQGFGASRAVLTETRLDVYFWVMALFSYPHLAASQWLCYSRGKRFLRQNWVELFAVPAVLIGAVAALYCNYERVGIVGLRFFLTSFLLLSGWHFAMQAFGSSLIGFYWDGIKLTQNQRTALKASLMALCLYFFAGRFKTAERVAFGVEILPVPVPEWAYFSMATLVVVAALWAAHLLVVRPWRQTRVLPSGRAIIPWLSLFFWWLPSLRSPEFFAYGLPLFHGLQQYAFTYRFERSRGGSHAKILLLAGSLVAVGFFLHWAVPVRLDKSSLSPHPNFFFFCFTFVINIHHYFLDRANWRLSDPETRRLMLGAALDAPAPQNSMRHSLICTDVIVEPAARPASVNVANVRPPFSPIDKKTW